MSRLGPAANTVSIMIVWYIFGIEDNNSGWRFPVTILSLVRFVGRCCSSKYIRSTCEHCLWRFSLLKSGRRRCAQSAAFMTYGRVSSNFSIRIQPSLWDSYTLPTNKEPATAAVVAPVNPTVLPRLLIPPTHFGPLRILTWPLTWAWWARLPARREYSSGKCAS